MRGWWGSGSRQGAWGTGAGGRRTAPENRTGSKGFGRLRRTDDPAQASVEEAGGTVLNLGVQRIKVTAHRRSRVGVAEDLLNVE